MPSSQISQKKLKAIVFTDIANFTKLSAQDEQKALDLIQHQNKIIKPIVEKYNGEWLKEIGDGLLLSFDSSLDAVQCSIQIQEALRSEDDLNLRIGIHQGDIFIKDGDVYGDDVNVASRVEPFSAVGGIAISHKVQADISSTPEYTTKYIGQPKLKGVQQEVKVYCITSHGLLETKLSDVSAKLEKKTNWFKYVVSAAAVVVILTYYFIPKDKEVPSIGILMMENLGVEDDNFWSRGFTEDLIVKVAGAGLIRVAPMKEILEIDVQKSFEEIAKKLGVKYLLTSSMHKKENSFDLRCQLIEAESGISTYAKKWSEAINNSTKIVGNLANDILKTLEVSSKQDITKISNTNSEAQELFYQARERLNKRRNENDIIEAKILLNKALKLEHNFIPARNMLAFTFELYDDFSRSNELYQQNYELATAHNDTIELINSLSGLAKSSSFEVAINYLNESIVLSKQINSYLGLAHSYDELGHTYYLGGLKEKALEYYFVSYEFYNLVNHKPISVLNNIGNIYRERENYSKALKYYTLSLTHAKEKNNYHAINGNNLQIAAINNSLGNYNKSNEILKEVYNLAIDLKEYNMCFHTLGYMVRNYIELDSKNELQNCIETFIAIAEESNNDWGRLHAYSHASFAYEKLENELLYDKYKALHEKYKKMLGRN